MSAAEQQVAGDCFQVAAGLLTSGYLTQPGQPVVLNEKSPWRIVHGTPMHPTGGFRHWHAWVEVRLPDHTTAIDLSNGHQAALPVGLYYKAGQLEEEHIWRFTPAEAQRAMRKFRHCGPWVKGWERIAR